MCNNCNCDNYDKCSIVGLMPIGFCCSMCDLYDEIHTCLKTKSKLPIKAKVSNGLEEDDEKIEPISTSIEEGLLKVVIKKKGIEIPIFIDLQKYLE